MEQPHSPISQAKTGPKEVFLHLLAIITLYFSAGSFLGLVFQYVNILYPDPLEFDGYGSYPPDYNHGVIRFSLASLIVVFPVYVLITRYLNKVYAQNLGVRTMRTRKWLTYFTLFVAALIIVGDLVTLVNTLLGGEVTVKFILKVITVLFVAASVFYYYFTDLKRNKVD